MSASGRQAGHTTAAGSTPRQRRHGVPRGSAPGSTASPVVHYKVLGAPPVERLVSSHPARQLLQAVHAVPPWNTQHYARQQPVELAAVDHTSLAAAAALAAAPAAPPIPSRIPRLPPHRTCASTRNQPCRATKSDVALNDFAARMDLGRSRSCTGSWLMPRTCRVGWVRGCVRVSERAGAGL